jgi:hypothetical protein
MGQSGYTETGRFFKSLAVVLLLIAISDFVIGKGMKFLYQKQKSGLLYRTTYCIDSTRADYLVFGSSRANHHYDPQVFENALHASFYNCGRDAQGVLYSCAVISAVIERYSPKCIIIDIRPDEFTQSDEGTLATLLPYHRNNAIRPYLKYDGRFQDVKLISSIYPYNSLFTNLLVGLKPNHEEDYKGYVPLYTLNGGGEMKTLTEKKQADSNKVDAFYRLLSKLNERHIRTLLVVSPAHAKYVNPVTSKVCSVAAQSYPNTLFLNFVNKPDWQDNKYFSDDNHLNNKGAGLFSNVIAKIIETNTVNN